MDEQDFTSLCRWLDVTAPRGMSAPDLAKHRAKTGAEAERAAIVAWLEAQGDRYSVDAHYFAEAIERGEHLKSEKSVL